jgi:3-polyprenyl-4-hydroxybenzoate decarboxylase
VDWDLEIGGITQEVLYKGYPALIFENIKDHEDTLSRKSFTGSLQSYSRIALMVGLPVELNKCETVDLDQCVCSD